MAKEIWDWLKTLAIAIIIVVIIRWILFDNYVVIGNSMEPNYHHKERLIVNKILYDFRAPKRGEVVVLHAPEGEDYIKRVIALEGEKVQVQGDDVLINGEKLEESYIADEVRAAMERGEPFNNLDYPKGVSSVTVPKGSVFVLGDNRPNSRDSRAIGFISLDKIVGRAEIVYWPLKRLEWVGHAVK